MNCDFVCKSRLCCLFLALCCLDLWQMAAVEGELFVQLYCCTVYNLREIWEGIAVAYTVFFSPRKYFLPFTCCFMGSWSLLLLPGPWRNTLGLSSFQEAYLTYRKDLHTLQRVRNGSLLSGESQGQGSLVGCRLWGHTESDTNEVVLQSWIKNWPYSSFWGNVRRKYSSLFQHEQFNFPYLSVPYNVLPVRYQVPWVSSPSLQLLIVKSWP